MSDKPMIQIDDDWKRQAQEEKRKLAEREAAAKKPAPPPADSSPASAAPQPLPEASFGTLVQSVMTQALYYLGELASEGDPGVFSLDAAKNQIDTLGVVEQKTKGNLSKDEQALLDQALYDLRSRYVSIASQYIR